MGVHRRRVTLFVGVTGIWNIFAKLALPVLALALLVLTGHVDPKLVTAAAIGVVTLIIAVATWCSCSGAKRWPAGSAIASERS